MHSRNARTFHHCLQKRFISFTQEFSLVVWLRVRPENEPKKSWSVPIFLGLSDRPKKKFALVSPSVGYRFFSIYSLSNREQGRCKTLVRELLIPPMWPGFRRILHAASCVD